MNLFARPVCDCWPEFAEEYSQMIKNPIDFQTIEEERLLAYEHIAELQDDLILTFRNCCVFNKKEQEYVSYAL